MTGIFKANNPSNNFLLFLYGLVLKLPLFVYPSLPVVQHQDAILYKSFVFWVKAFLPGSSIIFSFISFFLFYMQAVMFNNVINRQRMMPRTNYLPGMCYLLITSMFIQWYPLSAPLIINTLLVWIFARLCMLYNTQNPKTVIFNIGFLLGVGMFIYYPTINFAIIFFIGLAILRPFRLNEWLLGLVGIATTIYFFASWLFLTGQWKLYRLPTVRFSTKGFTADKWVWAGILLVAFAMLVGIFFIQNNMRRQIVQTRKDWQIIYLYLLITLFVPFVNDQNNFSGWVVMALPASLLVANSFYYPDRRWFTLFVHWAMFALSIAVGWFIR